MARSIHGTATNETSAQTRNQRSGFSNSTTGNLGAARTDMSNIFDIESRGNASAIMNNAKSVFNILYGNASSSTTITPDSHGVLVGSNPDFQEGMLPGNYKYTSADPLHKDVDNQDDKPNVFGPNLLTPNINNLSAPTNNQISSPTANKTNSFTIGDEENESNGFGIEIDRNDSRNSSGVDRPYFVRTGTTLGEYIDSDTYNYDE